MAKTESEQYPEIVAKFVKHGAELIREDRATRYGGHAPSGSRPLEPGFIPPDRAASVVIVSYYPNESDLDSPESIAYKQLREHFAAWGRDGTVSAYKAAYDDWLQSLPRIPFHTRWVQPILSEVGLRNDELAWLPLIKVPLPAQTVPNTEVIWRDRDALWQQLQLLHPPVLWLQGQEAITRVAALCQDKFPHAIVKQMIPQYPVAERMISERARIANELLLALAS